ncbi:hypothetical protein TcasGA2_TC033219 [Tribolium castaneum]|uniref:Uncharacterized protein n=1 Tax=Tribolium castaneum TaxID=7070 RepID=A0A139WHA9_TRICA|nr:PREDICTED: uncharacterized protein LOC103313260 [Tribolium castaneum]KYB27380.1 hypothetical protein TcasGA2_TC033219 [Tribolium castaneum]|eukprot:XP_008194321.1 PREDICTED: uncharacterized protein LOC103313260 [Tribolium castaneum]
MSVLPLFFLAVISFNGAYSLKCYACFDKKECDSPSEVTCEENETHCVAINTDGSSHYFFVTSRNCATEELADDVCNGIVEVNEGKCYKCNEDLCNEKLPELE